MMSEPEINRFKEAPAELAKEPDLVNLENNRSAPQHRRERHRSAPWGSKIIAGVGLVAVATGIGIAVKDYQAEQAVIARYTDIPEDVSFTPDDQTPAEPSDIPDDRFILGPTVSTPSPAETPAAEPSPAETQTPDALELSPIQSVPLGEVTNISIQNEQGLSIDSELLHTDGQVMVSSSGQEYLNMDPEDSEHVFASTQYSTELGAELNNDGSYDVLLEADQYGSLGPMRLYCHAGLGIGVCGDVAPLLSAGDQMTVTTTEGTFTYKAVGLYTVPKGAGGISDPDNPLANTDPSSMPRDLISLTSCIPLAERNGMSDDARIVTFQLIESQPN